MSNELLTILEYIEQERGISRESTVRALENAILTASRKSIHPASELKVKIDPPTGKIQAWAILEVVDGIPNSDQLTLARAQEVFPDDKVRAVSAEIFASLYMGIHKDIFMLTPYETRKYPPPR